MPGPWPLTGRASPAIEVARCTIGTAGMSETTLDLRGLRCPLPALKTRKALRGLAAGDRLTVECTDPLSGIDIPNLIRETGDVLESEARAADVFVFRIRKAGGK